MPRFRHARVYMGPEMGEVGHETVLEMWRKSFIFYEGGSPRCKHVITNTASLRRVGRVYAPPTWGR